ncbi:SusD/RagB family nutrient-binding outer membrane lipoprotein [Pedobacter sp. PAMC26386]|nr:SusD/RagB family nutrient-binding outer membrane lipoprotein [Pedobacter sp. PAMC26386]
MTQTIYRQNGTLRQLFLALLLLSSGLFLTSCKKNFDNYNTNPNLATDSLLKLDYVGIGAFLPQMQRNIFIIGSPGDASGYQVQQNLNADLYSGYMGTPSTFNAGRNNSNYAFIPGWNNVAFNTAYNNIIAPWIQIKRRASVSNPDFYAVANILKVEGLHRVTDIYGPIPYTNIGAGGFTVPYDAQDVVYKQFFKELDSAILNLTQYLVKNPAAKPFQKYDFIYDGDYSKWIKFANSLKLRLAMRIVYADPALAKQKAEEALINSYGVFESNTDNALLKSSQGAIIYNPLSTITGSYGDIRMGANMESFLNGYKDPRLPTYFLAANDYPGTFKGIRNGINIISRDDRIGFSKLNIQDNTPVQLMTSAEISFLRAEGALRGWNMKGSVQDLYAKGVRLSFDQRGVTGADTYLADATSMAVPYTDPKENNNNVPAGSADLSTITIKWNDGDSFETSLERIITQKWIAVYPDGQEAWSEFRRTGYPKIFPVVVNYSSGTIDTKKQVRRLPFPESEYQNNAAQVNKAVALLGGTDNGGTRLWWDKK